VLGERTIKFPVDQQQHPAVNGQRAWVAVEVEEEEEEEPQEPAVPGLLNRLTGWMMGSW
jgi:hypothetical protein